MSLELLNRRDNEELWRALARSSGVSEDLARAMWARAERETGSDRLRTEEVFRRMLAEAKELGTLGEPDSLLDPGKWTRVLDVQRARAEGAPVVGPKSDFDASALDPATRLRQAFEKLVTKSQTAARSMAAADGETLREALKNFRTNNEAAQAISAIDGGGFEQILRIADAMIQANRYVY
jgi:hypothetical protein